MGRERTTAREERKGHEGKAATGAKQQQILFEDDNKETGMTSKSGNDK
jgi:hypothetical protein